MTAYNARCSGKTPQGRNKKDGATGHRSKRVDWEGAGFIYMDWNKLTYTWQDGDFGDFPVIKLMPGTAYDEDGGIVQGMVATSEGTDLLEVFKYETPPDEIKVRLDDLILEFVRHEASLIEAEIEYNEEIGPEIDFDLWMQGQNYDDVIQLAYKKAGPFIPPASEQTKKAEAWFAGLEWE